MRPRGKGQNMLKLERFAIEDIPRLISWVPSQPEMIQWTGHFFQWPLQENEMAEHYRTTLGSNPRCFAFRARRLRDEQIVGHIELDLIDYKNYYASLARVLVMPPERSKGIGSAMVDLVVRLAFTRLPLQTLGLNVVSFNLAAIACYRRIGFLPAGNSTTSYMIGEKQWMVNQMVLQKRDWMARRNRGLET